MNPWLTGALVFFILQTSPKMAGAQFCEDPGLTQICDVLGDKELVLLGEFNHGSKEVFIFRNELILHLHEQHGFNVIFFESGFGEVASVGLQLEETEKEGLVGGFFGGWRTWEFVSLMEYAKSAGMKVAGYDVQRTGAGFERIVEEIALHYPLQEKKLKEMEEEFGVLMRRLSDRNTESEEVDEAVGRLISEYNRSLDKLNSLPPNNLLIQVAGQTLINRIAYLEYMFAFVQNKDWHARWRARDSVMVENVKWLRQKLYPDEKLVVIGHNFHIARYNENEEVMGEYLKKKFASTMYSLGVYAGEGTYLNNAGKPESMSQPDSAHTDLKEIILSSQEPVSFLDIGTADRAEFPWLDQPVMLNDTFIDLTGTNQMILSLHFDGLLLFKSVSPAESIYNPGPRD